MDYAEDLANYHPKDVRLACATWRGSQERRMPSPGELIALCRKYEPAAPVYALPAPALVAKTAEEKSMVRAWAKTYQEAVEAKPKKKYEFRAQGKPNERGITPELHAVVVRRIADGEFTWMAESTFAEKYAEEIARTKRDDGKRSQD